MATILSRWLIIYLCWLLGMALGLDSEKLLLTMVLGYLIYLESIFDGRSVKKNE